MCGIAGIVGKDHYLIEKVLSTIESRGPDFQGTTVIGNGRGVLGHRRLAILDLNPRSNQPFWSECGRYCLVYNGEIYNYIELRQELIRGGELFRTQSDTEVLLKWIIAYGIEGLCELDGMFAFALYDDMDQSIVLARDPLGEKPLYYAWGGRSRENFAFCSEIQGLKLIPHVDLGIDSSGISTYLQFLYTAPPHTMYKGIRELPPGCWGMLSLNDLSFFIKRYFDLEEAVEQVSQEDPDPIEGFKRRFFCSIERRLRSDVPVAIYLSAGLDSNAILSAARFLHNQDIKLKAFSIRYSGSRQAEAYDESSIAAEVALRSGCEIDIVDFSMKKSWQETAYRTLDIFKQPFGNPTAIVADQIANYASQSCRVALVGDGGDEICVGYPRYKALPFQLISRYFPSVFKKKLTRISSFMCQLFGKPDLQRRVSKFISSLGQSPAQAFLDWSTYVSATEMPHVIGKDMESEFYLGLLNIFERNQFDLYRAASLVDLMSFVPFNLMQAADRTSMAHSLEVRSPFLSIDLVTYSIAQPSNVRVRRSIKKPMLVNAIGPLLPREILGQPKKPFNPPIRDYIASQFKSIRSVLCNRNAQLNCYVNPTWIDQQLRCFQVGEVENSTLIWGLLVLECWLEAKAKSSRLTGC